MKVYRIKSLYMFIYLEWFVTQPGGGGDVSSSLNALLKLTHLIKLVDVVQNFYRFGVQCMSFNISFSGLCRNGPSQI